jgi:hypothetical protein
VEPGALPASIQVDDQVLPRPPSRETTPTRGEPVLRPDAADRTTDIRPDRTTTLDGVLTYAAVFNPSIVPFKRMGAFDRVEQGYRLGVGDPTLRPVPVTSLPTPPDRDPFWGSLVLAADGNRAVPIPSVAPEARLLSYSATPATQVRFFRDSADNFWVRMNHTGRVRLVFLTDAPRQYFSPQIPPAVTALDVPPDLRPRLPEEVRSAAQRVLRHIEVRARDTLHRQLERLVSYFRSFEPGPLPRLTGDTYLDIALSQKGVCRHRSLAFVITVQALGIPARYVHNEAHAFAEVFVPRLGWIRVDLGGASPELQVQGGEAKAIHDPGPDPFPRPARYAANYSQLGRNVTGIRPSQRLRRRGGQVSLRVYDRSRGAGEAVGAGASSALPSRGSPSAAVESSDDAATADAPPGPAGPSRAPTQIALTTTTRSVFRGDNVEVWGRVTLRDEGAPGLRVEIYLSKDGKMGDARLGTTVTGPDGRFHASLPVPRGIAVGDYQVVGVTPGDADREPSLSQ